MARIGEIDAAAPVNRKIARLVVILAVEQRVYRHGAPIGGELDQTPPAFLRAEKLPVWPERQSVHAIGVAAKLADRARRMVKTQQPAFVDDAEQHLAALVIPHNAAGRSLERPGDKLELPRHAAHLLERDDFERHLALMYC